MARVPVRNVPRYAIPVGGSGSRDPFAGHRLWRGKQSVTAAELVQKGDQICRTEQMGFSQIQAHPPANASIAADQTKELIETAESASSHLGDLEPPDELRAPFENYMSARDRAVDQMKRGEDAAENQDSRVYGAAQAAVVKSAPERKRQARAVGLQGLRCERGLRLILGYDSVCER